MYCRRDSTVSHLMFFLIFRAVFSIAPAFVTTAGVYPLVFLPLLFAANLVLPCAPSAAVVRTAALSQSLKTALLGFTFNHLLYARR